MSFLKRILTVILLMMIGSCAKVIMPTGGGKDTLPPVVTKETPTNKQINFTGKSFSIRFDEFIQNSNFDTEVLVSPKIEDLRYQYKGKKIKVSWEKPLKKETTYSFQFVNAIKDYHEGNPIPFYAYVFSTGEKIDSLSIQGKVSKPLENKTDQYYIALVEDQQFNDSSFIKNDKSYLMQSNTEGIYKFHFLPKKEYHIYAFEDVNKNGKWDKIEPFSYQQNPITPSNQGKVDLHLYPVIQKNAILSVQEIAKGLLYIKQNQKFDLEELFVLSENNQTLPVFEFNDSLFVNYNGNADSLTVLAHQDTFTVYLAEKHHKPSIWSPKKILTPQDSLICLTNYPISVQKPIGLKSKDTTIYLSLNSKNNQQFIIDQQHLSIGNYELIFPDSTLSLFQKPLRDMASIPFEVKPEIAFSVLEINVSAKKDSTQIVQLLNNKLEVVQESSIQGGGMIKFHYILPGKYYLRKIVDLNKNGVHDLGNPAKYLQPEPVILHPEALDMKPNWEVEIDF